MAEIRLPDCRTYKFINLGLDFHCFKYLFLRLKCRIVYHGFLT